MRLLLYFAICATLSGCAGGGSPVDQARNDDDLSAVNNAKLALASQIATDGRNLNDIQHAGGTARAAVPGGS